MTDRENFPANTASRDIAVSAAQRGSLVARGLAATKLALVKDRDTLYRQAREVYDHLTDCGGTSWIGERIGWKWVPISALTEAFITFQRLAAEGYGKAYYPLSTLYGGEQSVKGNEGLAEHFARLAFDWCLANSTRNDPEIWNDLGQLYRHRGNYELEVHWCRRAAIQNYPWGLFNMWSLGRSPNGLDEAEEGDLYWVIKAAEQGNLLAIIHMIHVYEGDTDHEPDDEQALYWYRKAAEQGYPWTEADFGTERFFDLGMRYRHGDGDEADEDKAEEYFLKAANLGHPEAQYELAELLSERGENRDSEHWLKCSAQLGYGPAQLAYAEMPFVPEEEAQTLIDSALDWYKAQAESGDCVSQFEYAKMMLSPYGDWKSNPEEGLHWLKTSAEQDYVPACRRLGNEYLRADISGHTTTEGIYWLSHAADLGDPWACEMLGDLYLLGHGDGVNAPRRGSLPPILVEPDHKQAVAWYELGIGTATPMGDRALAFKLGRHYLTGEHLQQDLQLAEKWLLHSAEHGYGSAQELLGDEYLSGSRLRKDVDAAIHWLELAGESSVAARLKLAGIYLDGKVVPQSLSKAIYWLTRDPDGRGRMNRQMKLVAEKCFDGRFSTAEESVAQAWLEKMANVVFEEAYAADTPFAAGPYYALAETYELGLGFIKDIDTAIYWYRRAAEQGHHAAKSRLCDLGLDWKTP
ncbi:MAG: tetratricopeptide repeat protein [Rhodocyclaceae bacterium]|nr:tetratricopeptide repeat protein [Rhodocyclaceae bacterium]